MNRIRTTTKTERFNKLCNLQISIIILIDQCVTWLAYPCSLVHCISICHNLDKPVYLTGPRSGDGNCVSDIRDNVFMKLSRVSSRTWISVDIICGDIIFGQPEGSGLHPSMDGRFKRTNKSLNVKGLPGWDVFVVIILRCNWHKPWLLPNNGGILYFLFPRCPFSPLTNAIND